MRDIGKIYYLLEILPEDKKGLKKLMGKWKNSAHPQSHAIVVDLRNGNHYKDVHIMHTKTEVDLFKDKNNARLVAKIPQDKALKLQTTGGLPIKKTTLETKLSKMMFLKPHETAKGVKAIERFTMRKVSHKKRAELGIK